MYFRYYPDELDELAKRQTPVLDQGGKIGAGMLV